MKNTIKKIMLAMAVVPLMASTAFAAAIVYQVPVANQDTVTGAQCPLLASTVTVGVSKDVFAAISCKEATGTIRAGTCSKSGSTATKTITCVATSAAGVTPVTFNDPTCDAAAVAAGTTFQSVGRSYFTMSTDGGGLTEGALNASGDTPCDATAVANVINPM